VAQLIEIIGKTPVVGRTRYSPQEGLSASRAAVAELLSSQVSEMRPGDPGSWPPDACRCFLASGCRPWGDGFRSQKISLIVA
jgi:hypothetical protein